MGLVPLIYAIVLGLVSEDVDVFILYLLLAAFIWIPATLSFFLAVNFWGLVKYKKSRKRFREIVIALFLYISFAIFFFLNWAPP